MPLDSVSLAKADCLVSASRKQGLQGGCTPAWLFSWVPGIQLQPSHLQVSHQPCLVPQAELSALLKSLKGWDCSSKKDKEGGMEREEEEAARGKEGEGGGGTGRETDGRPLWSACYRSLRSEFRSSKAGRGSPSLEPQHPMVRWEVGTGESPEVSRPSSLVYMTGNKRPTPKILLWPPPYAHCGVCTSLISLHTHACTHTDERTFTLTTNF